MPEQANAAQAKAKKARVCRFRCSDSDGVEICRGNGPQTFVDTCSKVACAKLYTTKTPITAVDLLNDRVLPLFEEHGVTRLRLLTDRGTEFCGRVDQHDYGLYLAVNDIDHTMTKRNHPKPTASANASTKRS